MKKINLKFKKLDRRHNGHGYFDYYVTIAQSPHSPNYKALNTADFNRFRDWCNETWGNSCERDTYLYLTNYELMEDYTLNTHWAWHVSEFEKRIYIKGSEEKMWINLKWT